MATQGNQHVSRLATYRHISAFGRTAHTHLWQHVVCERFACAGDDEPAHFIENHVPQPAHDGLRARQGRLNVLVSHCVNKGDSLEKLFDNRSAQASTLVRGAQTSAMNFRYFPDPAKDVFLISPTFSGNGACEPVC